MYSGERYSFMKTSLNQKFINKLKPPKEGEDRYYDKSFPNFGVVIYPNSRVSYFYFYKIGDKRRQATQKGTVALAEARKWATRIKAQVESGIDPKSNITKEIKTQHTFSIEPIEETLKQGQFRKITTINSISFESLSNLYTDRVLPTLKNKNTRDNYSRYLKRLHPILGHLQIDSISRLQMNTICNDFTKTYGKRTAGQTMTLLARMFNLAKEWDLAIALNPCDKIYKHPGDIRCRVFNNSEIFALFNSIDQEENPHYRGLFKLLFFTLSRKSEVINLKWNDLDLTSKVWIKSDTKNGKPHILPLIPQAMETIEAVPKFASNPYVFCGKRPGAPFNNTLSKPWKRIITRANVENATIHDIRRSMATWLLNRGVSISLISKLLNHSSIKVTETVYAKYDINSQRDGIEKLGHLFT